MAQQPSGGFDRIRPVDRPAQRPHDPLGKEALFSGPEHPPSVGSAAVTCPDCHTRTVVSVAQLAKLALPGVYAPLPGRGHRIWSKCPSCHKRVWLTITLKK